MKLRTVLAATVLTVAVAGALHHGDLPAIGTPSTPPAPAVPDAAGGKPTCTPANTVTDLFAGDCVAPIPDTSRPYPTVELDKADGGHMPDFLPGGFEALCDPASHSIQELRPDTPQTRADAAALCAR